LTSDVRILAECADARPQEVEDRWLAREEVGQLLGQLDPRERSIVQAHFGLDGQPSATYAQVGMRLGISKQRVRQIELEAIAKLRQAAD
jgi:RNA polymerase sigma factor (sigma-70 family)